MIGHFGAIGAGHMGGAVLKAVLSAGLFPPSSVHISSPVASELKPFAAMGCHTSPDNAAVVLASDIILLATRPHQVSDVLIEISPHMGGKCLLSIAAGVSVASMKALLPDTACVLRVMPNLPLAYGAGATVMAKPENVPERFVKTARAVFECGGIVEVLEEERMNASTALGGSGVAYFFRIAAVMGDWAEQNDIPADAALRIAAQTMLGASRMLTESGKAPGELASGVAVPGGTTEAAFRAFDEAGLETALRAGMDACMNRGAELNK